MLALFLRLLCIFLQQVCPNRRMLGRIVIVFLRFAGRIRKDICVSFWLNSLIWCFNDVFDLIWIKKVTIKRIGFAKTIWKIFFFVFVAIGVRLQIVEGNRSINNCRVLIIVLTFLFFKSWRSKLKLVLKHFSSSYADNYLISDMASTSRVKRSSLTMIILILLLCILYYPFLLLSSIFLFSFLRYFFKAEAASSLDAYILTQNWLTAIVRAKGLLLLKS